MEVKMRKHKLMFILVISIVLSIGCFHVLQAEDFNKEIFRKRRQKLMDQMEGGIAVFKNTSHALRNNDVFYYPFRSNSQL